MTLATVRLYFDYLYWSRDRILTAVEALTPEQLTKDLGSSFASVKATLVHLISSEVLWSARWRGESPTVRVTPDDFADLAAVRAKWQEVEAQIRAHLAGMTEADAQKEISYTTMEGKNVSYPFWQTALQVTNHSTYHRGQVATMLRQLGAKGVSTDLIAYFAQKKTAAT